MTDPDGNAASCTPRALGRWALGCFLVAAGVAHFAVTDEFLAQVPSFLPARTAIVYLSGIVEIGLGVALIGLPRRREAIGWAVAALFVLVLPGNINQALTADPAFGLDSDAARWGRLAFQPLLVAWALWSTEAWRSRRR